ncbi:MAG: tRNA epoxyqueuosine(34) reductase QueG [Pirellulales bacterium]|nr:tRNA epoxyqueuosine(34) reductase QueG [Pirellulales bacterium]
MDSAELTDALKTEARRLGFALAGVAPAIAPPEHGRLRAWVAAGCAGEMGFFASRAEAYTHPRHVLPGARSLLMLGLPYDAVEPCPAGPGQGRIARYAWGADYHGLIRARLDELARFLRRLAPDARTRGAVDTAPLLEREFGQMAGLGWIGRNTLLINPELGSWFFLAALLTTAALVPDGPCSPSREDGCGPCRACVEACPTGALSPDGQVDARRCVSYLTMIHAGPLPPELRAKLGDRLFGCDACQEVCPWNRAQSTPAPSVDAALSPMDGANPVDLVELLGLDDAAFRARFGPTPLGWAGRARVVRNACAILAHRPTPAARPALAARLAVETDPEVRRELEAALAATTSPRL